MRKRRDKLRDILRHFKARFRQRTGIECTNQIVEEITNKIQNEEAEFLERESNNKTHWKLNYMNHDLKIVYDTKRKTPVTCWDIHGKPWWEKIKDGQNG